jgi:hypothetical protein
MRYLAIGLKILETNLPERKQNPREKSPPSGNREPESLAQNPNIGTLLRRLGGEGNHR